MPRLVYIAGPYASAPASNTDAAKDLARVAWVLGKAPVVPHVSIMAGVWGHDYIDEERQRGRECSLALLRAVRDTGGELWVIKTDDNGYSQGTQRELDEWMRVGDWSDVTQGTWAEWQTRAHVAGIRLADRGFGVPR
jgi:hypothetical protein